MPKKPSSLSVNLLPGREPAFGEKFLTWSLTFGRYIIIGTEIIVLIAFLSRFKLDRDFIDLTDKVKQKQVILASQRPIEENVMRMQKRLSQIKAVEDVQSSGLLALPFIGPVTPDVITYETITVAGDKVTIVGKAATTEDISQFAAILKAESIFKKDSVTLEKIERISQQTEFVFTIHALVEKRKT